MLSSELVKHIGRCSLDIEMETGTGKTYVYIKTMFELNKRYGWNKFIVVVPSIAIREGVKKSFDITQNHFMELYGQKARYFIYNSSDLGKLDDFSSNSGINVMIINTQAFATSLNKDKNIEGRQGDKAARIIYTKRDEFGSRRPIDVIAASKPIIILDEPQKMGGEVTQSSLKSFKPLFCLNYSATHKDQHNLIHVLDALDAYNQRLVKKIQVKGIEVQNLPGTHRYLYLEKIELGSKRPPVARLELEINYESGIKRKIKKFKMGDNLYPASNNLEQYRNGYVITDIDPTGGGKIVFQNGEEIRSGQIIGDIAELNIRRVQIRETIISHLEKEQELFKRGIKTLSLFFIDEVKKYRVYDDEGNELPGEYGKIFEEEYDSVLKALLPRFDREYKEYLKNIKASETHRGYFSVDKKTGRSVDSEIKRGRDTSDDISAYDLIMKKKEVLLSFEEKTRFIFSHSALREGWDNPNIFQICTLKHSDSSVQKRQEVGRGLRLCVNSDGTRMDNDILRSEEIQEVNKLTVIASESYAQFVGDLQKKIKEVLYERPTKASREYFIGKSVKIDGETVILNEKQAIMIYQYLLRNDYIDYNENITDNWYNALSDGSLKDLPEELKPMTKSIHSLIQGIFDERVLNEMIENGKETEIMDNQLNDNFYKEEFQTLWNHINHHYAYTVSFDSDELIKKAVAHIDNELYVSQLRYTTAIGEQNTEMRHEEVEKGTSFQTGNTSEHDLRPIGTSRIQYDLIGKIAQGSVLTRRTTAKILQNISPEKYAMFNINSEEFIDKIIKLIKEQKAAMIVDCVSYNRTDGAFDSSIFTAQKNQQDYRKAFRAKKSVQDYVFTDGAAEESVERRFVRDLDNAAEVCVYAKLPRGFYIPTPVGNYSPDWAIAFNKGSVKHIFFIAETKGTMETLQLKPIEKAKISCARKLFNKLSDNNVKYHDVDCYKSLLDIIKNL